MNNNFVRVGEIGLKFQEGAPGEGYGRIKVHDCRNPGIVHDGHITHIEKNDDSFASVRVRLDTGFELTFHLPIIPDC